MSKLVVFLVLLVVGLGGVGFYREWFHFGKSSDPDTGQTEFKLSVDQEKVKTDVEKARQQITPVKPEPERH
jgi:hypothetical protein